jgi:ribosomal protein S18 acetylase RimI-like enzyme
MLPQRPDTHAEGRATAAVLQARLDARIIDARPEYAKFIAWVVLEAHRSHLDRGLWDVLAAGPEQQTLHFLEALALSDVPHPAHYSTFMIASVDGRPAAALSGYLPEEFGPAGLAAALPSAARAAGMTRDDLMAGWSRAASILRCTPVRAPNAWVIENVATLPQFRRQGLAGRLLAAALERGRACGATFAEAAVLIRNEPAQRMYEQAGFRVTAERRDPGFEAVYGSPGIRTLTRHL